MRALSAPELLSVWECVNGQSPLRVALGLLAAACPESSLEELARLSIAERDAALLTLREWLFGSRLNVLTTCPTCGEQVELSLSVQEIRAAGTSQRRSQTADEKGNSVMSITADGYKVHFRLPNSLDLVAIESLPDIDEARGRLLQRCVVSVEQRRAGAEQDSDTPDEHSGTGQSNGRQSEASRVNASRPEACQLDTGLLDACELPTSVAETVAECMAQADPLAASLLALNCPECNCRWEQVFDVAPYLAREIDAWAHRITRDVHALASAYGWSETDILAMSPARRQAYLDLIHHH